MAVDILAVGLAVFIAHLFVAVFKRTGVPDVLLLMLCGIVAGPILKIVTPADFGIVGPVISSVALIVILFEGGLSLKLRALFGAAAQTTVIALLSWIFTAALAAAVMYALTPVGPGLALMTGAIVGGTSSAVVIPLLGILKLSEKPTTVMFLESAITDVLCIVVAIGIAQGMSEGTADPGRIVGRIGLSFSIALVLGVAGALAWSVILGWVRQFPNTIFASVAWILVLYGVAELVGVSGAIASLAAGVTMANSAGQKIKLPFRRQKIALQDVTETDRAFFGEVVFLLKTFFFFFLGISIRFDSVMNILVALVIVALVFMMRLLLIKGLASRTYTPRESAIMSIMVPKGLAAAVLASLPVQYGLPGAEIVPAIVYPVVLVSIILTSILTVLIEKTPVSRLYEKVFAGRGPRNELAEASGDIAPIEDGRQPE